MKSLCWTLEMLKDGSFIVFEWVELAGKLLQKQERAAGSFDACVAALRLLGRPYRWPIKGGKDA